MTSPELRRTQPTRDFVLDETLEEENNLTTNGTNSIVENSGQGSIDTKNGDQDDSSARTKTSAQSKQTGKGSVSIEDALPVLQAQTCSIIIQNFPAEGKKEDLDRMLQGCGEVVDLKVRRLPDSSFVMMVVFDDTASKEMALLLNGTELYSGKRINIIPGGRNWEDYVALREKECTSNAISRLGMSVGSLNPTTIGKAFWGSISAVTKGTAELDSKLHIRDKFDVLASKTKSMFGEFDRAFSLRQKTAEAREAGRLQTEDLMKRASALDEQLGISNKVTSVANGVVTNSKIAAREIDESLGVSQKARSLTNSALQNEGFASGVQAARDCWSEFVEAGQDVLGPKTPRKKKHKNIVPTGELQASPLDRKFFEADKPLVPEPDDEGLED